MEIEPAEPAAVASIRTVVRASYRTSYALSPAVIDGLLASWFERDALESRLDDEAITGLVARADGDIVGYGAGVVGDQVSELRRIHVAPERRGEGIGSALFDRLVEALQTGNGTQIHAPVLTANTVGGSFYEHRGLTVVGYRDREIAGEQLAQAVYASDAPARAGSESVPSTVEHDGATRPVDTTSTSSGSHAPFYEVADGTEGTGEQYGFYCGNCGTVVVAADGLGRITCDQCGNDHRPPQWDGAYL